MIPFRLSSRVAPAARQAAQPAQYAPPARAPAAPANPASARTPRPHIGEAHPHPHPHPVPWRVSRRSERGVIEFEQLGHGPLRAVRVSLAGAGMLGLSLPRTVHPGERLRVVLRGTGDGEAAMAPDAMLVLRWFEPDGTELLWPVAL